jgi:hypothetical protein
MMAAIEHVFIEEIEMQTAQQFTAEEISNAQYALDTYPDNSWFWDSDSGQDALWVARRAGLQPTNTNRDRVLAHRELQAATQE